MKKFFLSSTFIFLISTLVILQVVPGSSAGSLIEKEDYKIDGTIEYKRFLNIAFIPLKITADRERQYLKSLLETLIKEKLLSYKKFRLPRNIENLKRFPFSSSGEEVPVARENPGQKITGPGGDGFLIPLFIEYPEPDRIKVSLENKNLMPAVPGVDLIINGEIKQEKDEVTLSLDVYNLIYSSKDKIIRKGAIGDIEKLKEEISAEIIKCIIVDHAYLSVSSSPPDAMIYIDERYFGRTGKKNILIESGPHNILLRKEAARNKELTVALEKNGSHSVDVKLDRKDLSPANTLRITTTPPGARVYLDSGFAGISPVVIKDLLKGTCRLRVDMEGYISSFQTVEINGRREQAVEIALEKGITSDYYYSRTDTYNSLFKYSLLGSAVSTFSFIYFGMKIEDEKAKQRGFVFADPDNHTAEEEAEYSELMEKTDDGIEDFTLYKNISLYSTIGLFITAGVFFYLDASQYDIDIAMYNPDAGSPGAVPGEFSPPDICSLNGMGLYFRMKF